MVRPLRVEYEDAYYHVMSRGKGRQTVFHGEAYYQSFLATLDEAHSRFGLQVLCYCLMGNHYHLLVKTPFANLSRCMRHINGVYTQRYNKLKKTDGPLFRGRYKAIIVETDTYQLQLSRYIHRNPLEASMVSSLVKYPWSSYPAYINRTPPPDWLYRDEVLAQLNAPRGRYDRYRAYVGEGIDAELQQFYSRGNVMSVLGSDSFRETIYAQREDDEIEKPPLRLIQIPMNTIVNTVAKYYKVEPEKILQAQRGRGAPNIPRWVAMYLCQEVSDYRLNMIAEAFGLSRYATVSTTIAKLKRLRMEDSKVDKAIKRIMLDLTPLSVRFDPLIIDSLRRLCLFKVML